MFSASCKEEADAVDSEHGDVCGDKASVTEDAGGVVGGELGACFAMIEGMYWTMRSSPQKGIMETGHIESCGRGIRYICIYICVYVYVYVYVRIEIYPLKRHSY